VRTPDPITLNATLYSPAYAQLRSAPGGVDIRVNIIASTSTTGGVAVGVAAAPERPRLQTV
jgi:hypothetical protein